jgi:hypothetical protein
VQAADISVIDSGVAVAVKGMGEFNLGFPIPFPGELKPVQKKIAGKQADLTYAGDIVVHLELADDRERRTPLDRGS